MTSARHILVMEPHIEGHHASYLNWMVEALVEDGYKLAVKTTAGAAKHSSFRPITRLPVRVIPTSGRKTVPSLNVNEGLGALIKREFMYWRLFREWYRSFCAQAGHPDIVFLPYLDYCLYAVGVLGSPFGQTKWAGVAMRPSFHYASMGITAPEPALATIKRALLARTLGGKSLRLLFTIDEPFFEYSRRRSFVGDKIEYLPEPVDFIELPDKAKARGQFALRQDRVIILLYGAITTRKGLDRLLGAALDSDFPRNITLIVAGRIDEEIKNYLHREQVQALARDNRLVVMDRYITPHEEGQLFAAADAVWLGYVGHYNSSGVLVQAAMAGRPVIACSEGILGWQTKRHKMGWVVDVSSKNDILRAIKSIVSEPEEAVRRGHKGRLSYADHSRANSMDAVRNGFKTKFD